jgi:predicted nucleic acid-binding protein
VILGADTGFFIKRSEQNPRALQLWQELRAGQHTLVVSTVSINELLAYFLRRGMNREADEWYHILTQHSEIRLVPLSAEVAAQSARYRLVLLLSTVDSMILTTCVIQQCDLLKTTDSDLETISKSL